MNSEFNSLENTWLGNQEFPLPDLINDKKQIESLFEEYQIHGLGYAYRIATGNYKKNLELASIALDKIQEHFTFVTKDNSTILWLTNSGVEHIFMIKYVRDLAQKLGCDFYQRPDRIEDNRPVIILLPLHQLDKYTDILDKRVISCTIFQEARLFSNHQYSKYSRYRLSFITKINSMSMIWLESLKQESYPLIDDFSRLPVNVIHHQPREKEVMARFFQYELCHQLKFDIRQLPYPTPYLLTIQTKGIKQVASDLFRIKPGKNIPSLEVEPEFKLALQFAQLKRSVLVVVDSRMTAIQNLNKELNDKAKFLNSMQNMISIISANELCFYPFEHNVIIFASGTKFDYSSFLNAVEHLVDKKDESAMIISQDFADPLSDHTKLLQKYIMHYRNFPPMVSSNSWPVHITKIPSHYNASMISYLLEAIDRKNFIDFDENELVELEENGCKIAFYPHITSHDLLGYLGEVQRFIIAPKDYVNYLCSANHVASISLAIHQIISFAMCKEELHPKRTKDIDIAWMLQDQDHKLVPLYTKLFNFIAEKINLNIDAHQLEFSVPTIDLFNLGVAVLKSDNELCQPAFGIKSNPDLELNQYSELAENEIKSILNQEVVIKNTKAATKKIRLTVGTLSQFTLLQQLPDFKYKPNFTYIENTNSIYDEVFGARTINQLTFLVIHMREARHSLIGVQDLDYQRLYAILVNSKNLHNYGLRFKYTCANQRQAIYQITDTTLDNNKTISQESLYEFAHFVNDYKEKYLPLIKKHKEDAESFEENKLELTFKAFPAGVYGLSRSKSIKGLILRALNQLTSEEGYLPAIGEYSYDLLAFKKEFTQDPEINHLLSFLVSLHEMKEILIVSDSKIVLDLVHVLKDQGYDLTHCCYGELNNLRLSFANVIFIGEPQVPGEDSQFPISASHLRLGLHMASCSHQTASFIIYGVDKNRLQRLLKFSSDSRLNLSFSQKTPRLNLNTPTTIESTNCVNPLAFYSSYMIKSSKINGKYMSVYGGHYTKNVFRQFVPNCYLESLAKLMKTQSEDFISY